MIPKSLSASSMHVAEQCMSRWLAENYHYSKGLAKDAASLGTACHGALESMVKYCRPELGGDMQNWNFIHLRAFFVHSYRTTFGTSEATGPLFEDGIEMLFNWFERQCWDGVEVLSCEIKENFPLKTSAGEIPFNYIWDRFDKIGPNEYKVVDYKTNRWNIRPEDLKKKLQARAYAVAAQIKHKDAERIWVEFDLLRHGPVGIVFSRDENIATWKFMTSLAQRIVDTREEDIEPTLNTECRFCSVSPTCPALLKNIITGGVFSKSAAELVDIRAELDFQSRAVQAAMNQIDEVVLAEAKAADVLEFESELNRLTIGVSARRSVDAERVHSVLGDELFRKYGSTSITMATVDKLLKPGCNDLTPEQKRALRTMIYKKAGEPSVKVEPKSLIDEE